MIAGLAAATALLAVLLGAVSWTLYGLLRQNGRLLLRIEGLEAAASRPTPPESLANSRINRSGLTPGTPAPDFRLPTLDGGEKTLADFRGRWLLLVFSDPECAPCQHLLPRLEQKARTANLPVLVVSRGTIDANRRKMASAGITLLVVLQKSWEISRLYAKFVTPVAYLIDPYGVISSPAAAGNDILNLVTAEVVQH
jgi:peroxiredoxin